MSDMAAGRSPAEDIALRYMDVGSNEYNLKKACSMLEDLFSEGDADAGYLYSLFLYTGTVRIEDRSAAMEAMSVSAASGNERAARTIREIGGSDKETADALIRLKLKGEQRDTDACRKLFDIYDNGKKCVKKDHAEAVRWYTVNAEKGDAQAQNTIGFMYLMGKGVPKDKDKAKYWLMSAAEAGNAEAMYHIADAYFRGINGVRQDPKEAMKWYELSAESGYPEAQHDLAVIYMSDRRPDFKRSAMLFAKAADQGEVDSIYQLGMLYAYGQGIKRDPDKAVMLLTEACDKGHSQAMFDYANMRFEGQVLEQDLSEAAKWFGKASEQYNATAQYCLACMYGNGTYFEKDDEKAAQLFTDAAEAGEPNSQYALACFCYEGRGVPKDEKRAEMWFCASAEQGHPAAKAFYGMMRVTRAEAEADAEEGLEMIKEVADSGYSDGQFYLGRILMEGKYAKKNIPLAKKYLKLAAKQGDPDASALLDQIR